MATALSPRHLFSSPPLKCRLLENKMLVGRDRGRQPFFVTQARSGCLSWCGGASAAASKTAAGAVAGAHDADDGTLDIKRSLYASLEGIDRGIFGATSEKKSEIEAFVEQLESRNPTSNPTDNLTMVDGCWKLIYSTISILGSKRTKLGLRGFISLGDFLQKIDVAQGKAINEIKFNVRGLTMLSGQLIVTASFKISSKSRVDINFESSSISPDELLSIFQKNYNLLLAIFNPDGWLEITYVDESFRIGRDNKGNIFILEKVPSS